MEAKDSGNLLALELFNKSHYLNPELQLQQEMQIILNELKDGIIDTKIKETGKVNPTYKLLLKRKEEIMEAKDSGNLLAIELFNKSYYLNSKLALIYENENKKQKLQQEMQIILNELKDGVINKIIKETGKDNPTYKLLLKRKEEIITITLNALNKSFDHLNDVDKLAMQLVSQSKYIQKNIAFQTAKEEYNGVVDFTKLSEMINNKESENVHETSL